MVKAERKIFGDVLGQKSLRATALDKDSRIELYNPPPPKNSNLAKSQSVWMLIFETISAPNCNRKKEEINMEAKTVRLNETLDWLATSPPHRLNAPLVSLSDLQPQEPHSLFYFTMGSSGATPHGETQTNALGIWTGESGCTRARLGGVVPRWLTFFSRASRCSFSEAVAWCSQASMSPTYLQEEGGG